MTSLEQAILSAILELEQAVKTLSTAAPKPDLSAHFAWLDELTRQLPKTASPDLLHYLHKKSYEKARLFLQGRESENQTGNCRHV